MSLRFFVKSSLLLSCFASAVVFASPQQLQVPCPSVYSIHDAAQRIDRAQKNGNNYIVYTSNHAFYQYNLTWDVSMNVPSRCPYEAIIRGKQNLQRTSLQYTQNAIQSNGHFHCYYGPGMITAVGHR